MKMFVFAVRDLAAQMYNPPFVVRALGAAERGFADAVNDPNHPFHAHPEDYELCQLGTFDDGTGLYEVGQPQPICTGKNVAVRRVVPPVSDEGSAKLS